MKRNQANEYVSRINAVIDYIDGHLGGEMTLRELADVAGFSEYHFHRIFAAMTGETLFAFIGRLRLNHAASQLNAYQDKTITQIALDCGFSSSAVFARAFKKRFGVPPSEYQNSKQSQTNGSLDQLLRNDGKENGGENGYAGTTRQGNTNTWRFSMKPEVKIEKFEETRVAYIRYVGPYAGDAKLFENLYGRLCAFTQPRGIDMSLSYIIYHDDPNVTEESKLRVSVCVPISDDVEVSGEVCEMTLTGGDYAVGSFVLGTDEYGQAWNYMYAQWLPTSGYKPAPACSFERYTGGECDCEGKINVDICIPVEVV